MIKEDIKKIRSEKSDLRKFGLSVGIVLGLLGGLFWWRDKAFYIYFAVVAVFLISSGLVIPSILRPLQKAWMTMAVVMGWFMTRVILSVLFFLVITPIRFIAKLSGKDFLDRKFSKDDKKSSYWLLRDRAVVEKSRYEKQF
ncbi:MAG: sxtJ [Candidatus Omnitrophica bacterium]|nr:sxtJ [Candidatus Omnitrophota bacterium]